MVTRKCPECDYDAELRALTSNGEQLETDATDAPAVVCECGAFLVMESGRLRLMTMDEVGEMPDRQRMAMMHAREHMLAQPCRAKCPQCADVLNMGRTAPPVGDIGQCGKCGAPLTIVAAKGTRAQVRELTRDEFMQLPAERVANMLRFWVELGPQVVADYMRRMRLTGPQPVLTSPYCCPLCATEATPLRLPGTITQCEKCGAPLLMTDGGVRLMTKPEIDALPECVREAMGRRMAQTARASLLRTIERFVRATGDKGKGDT